MNIVARGCYMPEIGEHSFSTRSVLFRDRGAYTNVHCENLLWQPTTRTHVLRANRYGHPLRFIRSEVISCLSPWKRANLPAVNMRAPPMMALWSTPICCDSYWNVDKHRPSLFSIGNKACLRSRYFCHPYCYFFLALMVFSSHFCVSSSYKMYS